MIPCSSGLFTPEPSPVLIKDQRLVSRLSPCCQGKGKLFFWSCGLQNQPVWLSRWEVPQLLHKKKRKWGRCAIKKTSVYFGDWRYNRSQIWIFIQIMQQIGSVQTYLAYKSFECKICHYFDKLRTPVPTPNALPSLPVSLRIVRMFGCIWQSLIGFRGV